MKAKGPGEKWKVGPQYEVKQLIGTRGCVGWDWRLDGDGIFRTFEPGSFPEGGMGMFQNFGALKSVAFN